MWDMKGDLNLLMRDMKGHLTIVVLVNFLQLQDIIAEVVLQPGAPDDQKWPTEAGGVFSTKSAYRSSTSFVELNLGGALTKASQRSKFYIRLAIHIRCLTANTFARRGLPHP